MKKVEAHWIQTGYGIIAEQGFHALTIEGLSRAVNKNKSSFYHHFGDFELFTGKLLKYHLDKGQDIIIKERKCQRINPDLFQIIMDHKLEVLFHRQLLVNRHIPEFEQTYSKITQEGVDAILEIWNKALNIPPGSNLGKRLLRLGVDRIFQNVSTNLNVTALNNAFEELKLIVKELRATAQ